MVSRYSLGYPVYQRISKTVTRISMRRSAVTNKYMSLMAWRAKHAIKPKLIPMLYRYQCDAMNCKRFIYYDEGIGKWVHYQPRG